MLKYLEIMKYDNRNIGSGNPMHTQREDMKKSERDKMLIIGKYGYLYYFCNSSLNLKLF